MSNKSKAVSDRKPPQPAGEPPRSSQSKAFAEAQHAQRQSLVSEFIAFLGDNKKWWLLPILIMFLLMGALVMLGGSGAAPFIYTLF